MHSRTRRGGGGGGAGEVPTPRRQAAESTPLLRDHPLHQSLRVGRCSHLRSVCSSHLASRRPPLAPPPLPSGPRLCPDCRGGVASMSKEWKPPPPTTGGNGDGSGLDPKALPAQGGGSRCPASALSNPPATACGAQHKAFCSAEESKQFLHVQSVVHVLAGFQLLAGYI